MIEELNQTPQIEETKKINIMNTAHKQRTVLQTALVSVGVILIVLIIIGDVVWYNRAKIFNYFASEYMQKLEATSQATPVADEKGQIQAAPSLPVFTEESFVVDAVKKTNPAVVSIIITKDVPKYTTSYQQMLNPFGDMFGGQDPFGNMFQIPIQQQNGTEKQQVGGGSGFFVTGNGMVVTNRHVVEDKTAEYTVFTNDGKKHPAKVIARDSVLDIAVLQIDGSGYPYLTLGDSDKLSLGQSVIAIGNALGQFQNTVSVGVISGLSRSLVAGDTMGQSESLDHVIQTDAAINPGNSGGPLLNLRGEVVGVNVAMAQGSQNIGFALPINSIKTVIDSVKATGKIVRPYVGVRYIPVTAELKDKNNLSVDYGVLVARGQTATDLAVIPGSPADKAGLLENDIILSVDGQKLDADTDFSLLIRQKKVGDIIVLKVLSKGVEKTLSVKLEAAPQ